MEWRWPVWSIGVGIAVLWTVCLLGGMAVGLRLEQVSRGAAMPSLLAVPAGGQAVLVYGDGRVLVIRPDGSHVSIAPANDSAP